MQQLEALFQEIGFDKKSAQVYLVLLKLGEANLEQLARHSGIPRTSLYRITDQLLQQNIIARFPKRKRQIFVAQAPHKILAQMEEKVSKLRELTPRLESAVTRHPLPKILFFENENGIKTIFQEILAEKRNFDAITSVDDMLALSGDRFQNFIQQRIKQRLPVRLITHRTPETTKMKHEDRKMLRETRFVPSKYVFTTANYIFGDNTAIISLGQEQVFGIIIKDTSVAATYQMYFNLLWDMVSTE